MLCGFTLFPLSACRLLGPFPLCLAFPGSEYYDPSAVSASHSRFGFILVGALQQSPAEAWRQSPVSSLILSSHARFFDPALLLRPRH